MGDRSSVSSTSSSLQVCETFVSLCGETTFQGLPAFFVRTSGCNLRCRWCDTAYAWEPGESRTVASLLNEAKATHRCLAVITGGEPLLQPAINDLIAGFAERDWVVLIETNGTLPIAGLDPRARRIVDVKPPSAKAGVGFLTANLDDLRITDELKFVVADRVDFQTAIEFVEEYGLIGRCPLLVSPAAGETEPAEVAEWLLETGAPFRLQLQLHKILWGDDARGR